MDKLLFTQNFNNKLFSDIFNHVGLHALESHCAGDEVLVYVRDMPLGRAKVVAVHTFPFSKINDVLGYLTIGKPAQALAEQVRRTVPKNMQLYADTMLSHIVYQYTERHLPNQQQLLQAWWQEQVNNTDPVFDEATIYHNQ